MKKIFYYNDRYLLVRRNETICCLIGFGIGVGCCILYRLISNFLTPATSSATSITNNTLSSLSNNIRDVSCVRIMFSTASNEAQLCLSSVIMKRSTINFLVLFFRLGKNVTNGSRTFIVIF